MGYTPPFWRWAYKNILKQPQIQLEKEMYRIYLYFLFRNSNQTICHYLPLRAPDSFISNPFIPFSYSQFFPNINTENSRYSNGSTRLLSRIASDAHSIEALGLLGDAGF